MKIYLCRHGQTTGDVEDRYGGDYDDHLTGLGMHQAERLADEISNNGIQKIYSSPLSRAKETAKIISLKTGNLEIEEIPELRERNWYGVLTGLTKEEAIQKFPDQVEILKDYRKTLEQGESYDDLTKRVKTGLSQITLSSHEIVLAVIHGGVFKNIFREMLGGIEIKKIEDCGFAELEWNGEKFNILYLHGIEVLSQGISVGNSLRRI
jgi:broad specificity phosphatase PhoE